MEQQLIEFLTALSKAVPDDSPIMEGSRQRALRRTAKAEYPEKMAAWKDLDTWAQSRTPRPDLPSSGSQAARQMGKTPGQPTGGPAYLNALIKTLHTDYGMSHNQEFVPSHRVLFGELKKFNQGAWALIVGTHGCAATKWDGNVHQVVVSSESGVDKWSSHRGGYIEDYIVERIGKMLKFYQGVDNAYAPKKRAARKNANKAAAQPNTVTVDSLVMRLKPLWMAYIKRAEADIGGMIKTMIQAGAYERATKKLQYLTKIDRVLKKMETGEITARSNSYNHDSVVDFVSNSLKGALAMAAHQFYPEETGEIRRDSSGSYSGGERGVTMLLNDIGQGDVSKIAVAMRYFKRTLL